MDFSQLTVEKIQTTMRDAIQRCACGTRIVGRGGCAVKEESKNEGPSPESEDCNGGTGPLSGPFGGRRNATNRCVETRSRGTASLPRSCAAVMGLVNVQYTVFSEGAARHFCLVGGALRRYISGRGGAPDRRRPQGGRWRSSRRAEVRQHQVAGAHFEGRALVRHTQSVREETGAEARLDAGAGVPGAREARLVRGCHLKAPPPPFAPQRAAKLS